MKTRRDDYECHNKGAHLMPSECKPSSELPWSIEVHNKTTSIESRFYTVTNDVSNEDAEFIVRAVNAHDGLLKALKELELWADDACARTIQAKRDLGTDTNDTMRLLQNAVEFARKAITQAEGK